MTDKQTHRSCLDLGQAQTNTQIMAWLGTDTNKHTDHGLTWDRHKQTHRFPFTQRSDTLSQK